MNNTSNPTPSQPHDDAQPEAAANPQASPQQAHCRLDPLCSAVNDGAHRARAAAQNAIPKVKAAVSGATYWLGYGVSFATVFSYIIVKELAPQVFKAGCRDGAVAGQKTGEEVASKLSAQRTAQGGMPSSGADPSGPATQPGAA